MRQEADIRLVALDLDGTLLNGRKEIPQANIEALRECERRGIRIVLASGRMTPSMERPADALGADTFLISYNGAVICASRADGRGRLEHRPLPAETAAELIRFGLARRYMFNFYHEDRLYGPSASDLRRFADIYSSRTGAAYEFLDDFSRMDGISPSKFLYVTEPDERECLVKELLPIYGGRCTIVRTDPEYLEFLGPGVDKGTALARLLGILGLRKEHAMAIGDGDNDVPLLSAAGTPVAMANASPPCKAAAIWITGRDNDEGGVAEALERFLF